MISSSESPAATLFTGARIFDGSGAALFPGEVLVRGGIIEAVARGSVTQGQ